MCNLPTLDPLAPKRITNSIAELSYIDTKLFGHDNPQEGGERGAEDEAPMHASGGKRPRVRTGGGHRREAQTSSGDRHKVARLQEWISVLFLCSR
jgi:hypothetical protein